ncbi:MAG: DUF3616 domain-containing protein [Geitlerinemataceae cyanobacterium]
MSAAFLLSRIVLRFNNPSQDLRGELSAATLAPDGSLWVGSDEFLTVERLSPVEPGIYGNHQAFPVADFIDLFNDEDEIDIEGMDFSENYLWLTGSHSTKRKKPKGKKQKKDIKRLANIKTDANRYILARIPVVGDTPFKSCSHPKKPDMRLSAACLQTECQSNILIAALKSDPHLAPFLAQDLPSKDNGLDIEGLAVCGDRIFLGLRGPVLRGLAIVLEIEVEEKEPGILTLKEIGEDGKCYRKYFVDLHGLGVRELCLVGEDLLILAGPTMALAGYTRLFRLNNVLDLEKDSIFSRDNDRLELVFDLPFTPDIDNAEGLALLPCLGYKDSLLVLYDSPAPCRKIDDNAVLADIFRLP